jgi:translation initiation factor 2 subunit 2
MQETGEEIAFDFGKKKKAKPKAEKKETTGGGAEEVTAAVDVEHTPPRYSYVSMLERLSGHLREHNPDIGVDWPIPQRRYVIPPPRLMKVGTKKTLWVNFKETCAIMAREMDHVFKFMMAELGTEGSIDGSERLVIKGKFLPKVQLSLLLFGQQII